MYVEGGKWGHVGQNQGKGIGRILQTELFGFGRD